MMKHIEKPVLFLVGPTAIGKTALSIEIAQQNNCEIISMDSMQVYRYMDIGTAKVTVKEQAGVPHHLLDVVNPDDHYDASLYCRDALAAIEEIHNRGKLPLVTGGTGLYLQSLTQGFFDGPKGDPDIRLQLENELQGQGAVAMWEELQTVDPASSRKIHANDSYRVLRALEVFRLTGKPLSEHIAHQDREQRFTKCLKVGLTTERDKLYERINLRTSIMLEQGLEQEVRGLIQKGYGAELKSMGSIGYKHMLSYINGDWTYEEMQTLLARDTRRYAKRQYTWFNKEQELHWFDVRNEQQKIKEFIQEWCSNVA